MNRLFLSLLVLLHCACMYGANISKRYRSYVNSSGVTYFFYPYELKKVSNAKTLKYDMTYTTGQDSVTVNISILSQIPNKVSEITVGYKERELHCSSFSHMFIDMLSKRYEVRTTTRFSLKEIEDIFSSRTPPVFIMTQGTVKVTATFGATQWKKESAGINRILNLIESNNE